MVYIAQYTRISGLYYSIYKNQWFILLNIQESVVYIAQYTRISGVYCSISKNQWCILLNKQESVVYILYILSQFHHTPVDLLVKVNLKFHCIANYAHMYNQATTVQCENTLVHIGLCILTITNMHTGMYAHMYTHTHTYVPGLYRV